jgi:RNA polymerase sigma factor (sigma-70 family)
MDHDKKEIWQELYSYESDIYGFIKNAVVDGDIARDLYQDIFLSALQNISLLDENRSLKNWLYTVTRNRIINYFRLRKRREFEEFKDSTLHDSIFETTNLSLINKVLLKIPIRQKQVILLREIEGWTYEELAKKMNLNIQGVTSLLKRARENFQKYYILEFLPDWFGNAAQKIGLKDVIRFINPFNPPLDLVELINEKSQAYFAGIKAGWDQVRKKYVDEKDLVEIWKNIKPDKKLVALDCGSGTGFISIALALQNLSVYALDQQEEMVYECMKKKDNIGLTNLKIIQGDIKFIPFANKSFDLLFFTFVLHHTPDPAEVIKSSLQLIKKHGYLIVIDFLRHNNKKLADSMHDLWLGFQPETFKKITEKNNFTLKKYGEFRKKESLRSFYQIWQKK